MKRLTALIIFILTLTIHLSAQLTQTGPLSAGSVVAGTANQIDVTGNAVALDPAIIQPGTFTLTNPGTFATGSSIYTYNNSLVNCPSTDLQYYYNLVQFNAAATFDQADCIETTGTGANQGQALFLLSVGKTASTDAVAASMYAFTTVNNGQVNVFNPVAEDITGLTHVNFMTGAEIDVQPENATSVYGALEGLNIHLYNQQGASGQWPFTGLEFSINNAFSASSSIARGIEFDQGILNGGGTAIDFMPNGTATSSNNQNGPIALRMRDSLWNGSAAVQNDYSFQVRPIPATGTATADELYIYSQEGSDFLSNHHITLTSYQNMDLAFQHSDSGLSTIGVPSSLTGVSNITYLPPYNGTVTLSGWPAAPAAANCLPKALTTTDYSLGCSSLTDNGTTVATTEPVTAPAFQPGTLYSAAGTALPTCAVGIKGRLAVVSDATSPTFMGAYTSGGGITAAVICSYNGTTYSWLTH